MLDEDGVDVRGDGDVAGGHVADDGFGGVEVDGAGVEEAFEDGAVGAAVCGDAGALHVVEEFEDGGLLGGVGSGVEGAGRVGEQAVEDDGEGCDVGFAA